MLTLKAVSSDDTAVWHPGVIWMSHIARCSASQYRLDTWHSYHPTDYAIGKVNGSEGHNVHLLFLRYQDGREEYVVVEKAYLLGPDGTTIDKIA